MLILRRGRVPQPGGLGLDVEPAPAPAVGRQRRQDYRERWRPPVEVVERATELVVRVEIAGLSLAEVEVLAENDEVRVRGERSMAYPDGPRLYHESQIRYGPFEATVRLPFPVAVDEASADYVDGLLTIRMPRRVASRVPMRDDSRGQGTDQGER